MKLNRFKHFLIQMAIFIATYMLADMVKIHFTDRMNVFAWVVRNNFMHIWILVMIFTFLGRIRTGYTIVISNFIGLFIGQYLGDYLKALNVAKITPNMSDGEIYMLNSHKGVYFWIETILLSMLLVWVIGFIHKIIVNRKNKNINRVNGVAKVTSI